MDVTKYLFLLKGEDKTSDIQTFYKDEKGYYHIVFKNSKQEYRYDSLNCLLIENPNEVDVAQYRIKKNDTPLNNIKRILYFKDYLRIFYQDKSSELYCIKDLNIETSYLFKSRASSVYAYFKKIVEFTGTKSDTGENHLLMQYDNMSYPDEQSVLAKYLKGILSQEKKEIDAVFFPFGCNMSQREAVKKALKNTVSVIKGPPGTGKTQTILNIIANLVIMGKTVAVVSGNNSAIENVIEKLQKKNLDFITASLGKSDKRKEFFNTQKTQYPDIQKFKCETSIDTVKKTTANILSTLDSLFKKKNRFIEQKKLLEQYKKEMAYFIDFLNITNNQITLPQYHKRLKSKKILLLWKSCEKIAAKYEHLFIFIKLKLCLFYRFHGNNFLKKNITETLYILKYLYYKQKIRELESETQSLEKCLNKYDFDNLLSLLLANSWRVLLHNLYLKYASKKKRTVFELNKYKNNLPEFTNEYPVVFSTTHSIKNCIDNKYLFDYLIVDEASQVDLSSGVLALSCAKNAVIVGDLMQLPNIVSSELKKKLKPIFDSLKIDKGYNYCENSLLSSVCSIFPNVQQTLLREHYRCHPKIINFCNQKFYNNELIIMTRDKHEPDVLTAYLTVKGNHARGHINLRQIEGIKDIIPKIEAIIPRNDIGVISPYNPQVGEAKSDSEINDLDISTVHKYQGREKDAIIITTVDNQITDFIDNPNMLNVAVSRAKKQLCVIVSNNEKNNNTNIGDLLKYIEYTDGTIIHSSIYSIFDLLYKDYESILNKKLNNQEKISRIPSENLVYSLLKKLLKQPKFSRFDFLAFFPLTMLIKDFEYLNSIELLYAKNPATHIDFIIYNKFDKQPTLAIEVDGYQFHKKGTKQNQRDQVKNQILQKYSIPLLRLNTTECKEEERITQKLNEIIF